MKARNLSGRSKLFGIGTCAGFTLLELLISITLLGFILVLLFGGLRLGIRSWDSVQKRVDNQNTVRAIESTLRREFEMAHPLKWDRGSGPRVAFHGEREQVTFVAPLPSGVGLGGLHLISLQFRERREIFWKSVPFDGDFQRDFAEIDQSKGMSLIRVGPNVVEDIWFSYFGSESGNDAPHWLERWDSSSRLPSLIRIQAKFADGSEWPELVVSLRLSSAAAR
jgi:general secretion pathway protein J